MTERTSPSSDGKKLLTVLNLGRPAKDLTDKELAALAKDLAERIIAPMDRPDGEHDD